MKRVTLVAGVSFAALLLAGAVKVQAAGSPESWWTNSRSRVAYDLPSRKSIKARSEKAEAKDKSPPLPSGPAAAMGAAAGEAPRRSIWPAIYPRLLELILERTSTIVFVNSRRLAERLATRLNELAGEDLVRAHHGSIAREQRLEIEDVFNRAEALNFIIVNDQDHVV